MAPKNPTLTLHMLCKMVNLSIHKKWGWKPGHRGLRIHNRSVSRKNFTRRNHGAEVGGPLMIGPGEIVRPYYLHLRVLSPLLMSAGSISSQNEEDLGDHIPCKIFTVNSVLFNKNVLPKFIPIGAPAAIENDSNDNDNRNNCNYGDINEDAAKSAKYTRKPFHRIPLWVTYFLP